MMSDESVKEAECDYHYKYRYDESIALVELVSHIEDSKESTLTPGLELSTLCDVLRTCSSTKFKLNTWWRFIRNIKI